MFPQKKDGYQIQLDRIESMLAQLVQQRGPKLIKKRTGSTLRTQAAVRAMFATGQTLSNYQVKEGLEKAGIVKTTTAVSQMLAGAAKKGALVRVHAGNYRKA